ncbi:MAG TPA: carboxypeptidase-like regulatory domain-containing protein, partial [Candidatus Paceibacterota bacterium]
TLTEAGASVADGTLQVASSGTITASYTDNEDVTDTTASTTATVTVPPPPASTDSGGGGGGGGPLGLYGTVNTNPQPPASPPGFAGQALPLPLFVAYIPPSIPNVANVIKAIADFFFTQSTVEGPPPPALDKLGASRPLVFSGLWQLLDPEPIIAFALAPLPKPLALAALKFPEFAATFESLGVSRLSDLEKLLGSSFVLPKVENLADLPTETILALGPTSPTGFAGQAPATPSISYANFLDISEEGVITQRVNAVSGQPLTLAVRPERQASSVTGYLVLKENRFSEADTSKFSLPLSSLAASAILSQEPLGKATTDLPTIENHLLLNKFVFEDEDGDSVWTADIQAPLVASLFEVITVIDYEDPDLGNKELRFALVVDPEGYVYANLSGGELRVEKAEVSMFVRDKSGRFVLWPAADYQQRNPQITGRAGEYSFLVPPGEYYMSVEASGYKAYQGSPFMVTEGSGVHENIELQPSGGLLRGLGWPWVSVVVMLLAVILLLAYNFYKDRLRSRY